MNDAIRFEEVNAGYRNAPVLHNISFEIPKSEFWGVIGPNGSGKTTLLRTITGLIKPLSGKVMLFDRNIATFPAEDRARTVGVVPQSMETPMAFTVAEIVMIGRTASMKRWGQPSRRDQLIAERAMVYTDVIDIRNKLFSELSGGERQRTVVAMILAQQPEIILLDEATSHLDINHRLEVMQIVERLHSEEGTTVVMVSHDLNLAAEFCSHLVLLDHGKLVSCGPSAEVLDENILREVYNCNISVRKDLANGTINVVPAPRLAPEHSGQGVHVHVIAGGGCGEEIMRRLSICEYTVTCGVLNEQDSDTDVAEALDIKTVLERPFSPVSREAVGKAQKLIDETDVVVVSGVPFGTGNVANLKLAEKALADGKQVLVMNGVDKRDYTPDKSAGRITARLLENGAVAWTRISDLLNMLPHRKK